MSSDTMSGRKTLTMAEAVLELAVQSNTPLRRREKY